MVTKFQSRNLHTTAEQAKPAMLFIAGLTATAETSKPHLKGANSCSASASQAEVVGACDRMCIVAHAREESVAILGSIEFLMI